MARISNEDADKAVAMAINDIKNGAKYSKNISRFMDLVVNVQNYDINNHRRQGVISRTYAKESIVKFSDTGIAINIADLISEFWSEVFNSLDKVKPTGGDIVAKSVAGAGIHGGARQTKCNSINYLRSRGIMAVRNYINNWYRHNLVQICNQCRHESSIHSEEYGTNICPSCSSSNTEKWWPSGHASFRSKKCRRCLDCGASWTRKFMYVCPQCKSADVYMEMLNRQASDFRDKIDNLSDDINVESMYSDMENEIEMQKLVESIRNTFHINIHSNTKSKSNEIFDLIFPVDGVSPICKMCVRDAPMVCSLSCGETDCTHEKIPDPKYTCGAEKFSMATCVNFSKKIAKYHGCSTTLAARRVEKVRTHFIKYVLSHKDKSELCVSLYEYMQNMHII
jgi:Zn finger protein HypA/HybF involved in hydrogenase expression